MKRSFIMALALMLILSLAAPAFAAEGTSNVIPDFAYQGQNITSIHIPANVTSIGKGIFADCNELSTVTVDEANPVYYSFGNCIIQRGTNRLVAGCKNSYLLVGITAINDYAFYKCAGLTEIGIPDTVRYIGEFAFSQSGLTGMDMPDSVIYIGQRAFESCPDLQTIYLSESLTFLPHGLCYNCPSLIEFRIPESVTTLDSQIFNRNEPLSVYVPSSIVNIAEQSLDAPRYTRFYYSGTFTEWERKIDEYSNPYLEDAKHESLRCSYDYERVMDYWSPDGDLHLKIRVVNGEGVIYSSDYAVGSVAIPSEVEGVAITKMDSSVFASKKELIHVTFPDSIKELGSNTFYACNNLRSVTLPKNITEIPDTFFFGCKALEEVELPAGLSRIGENAFYECDSLKKLTVPDGVTYIGWGGFAQCDALEEVDLPDSVTTFERYVFSNTPSLRKVNIPAKLKILTAYTFENSGIENISIPQGLEGIEMYAFYGSSLKSIVIPGTVEKIGEMAFGACKQLESLDINAGTASIGRNAFMGCSALQNVKFVGRESIPDNAGINKAAVKAEFVPYEGTVSFDTKGGTAVAPIYCSGSIFHLGNTVRYEPYSTKDGYVLQGWYSDPEYSGNKVSFPYWPEGDTTLYAKWVPVEECIIMQIDSKTAWRFGEQVENDVAPVIRNDRTMLPVRFVAESLGAEVGWIAEAKYVRVAHENGTVIDMHVGDETVFAGGTSQALDSAPFIENDRTYTPVRFVAEALGAEVLWVSATRQVVIIPAAA